MMRLLVNRGTWELKGVSIPHENKHALVVKNEEKNATQA